jgi:hypothetical protein
MMDLFRNPIAMKAHDRMLELEPDLRDFDTKTGGVALFGECFTDLWQVLPSELRRPVVLAYYMRKIYDKPSEAAIVIQQAHRGDNAPDAVKPTWCCAQCGSSEVDLPVWVNANTGERGEYCSDQAYCNECEFEGRLQEVPEAKAREREAAYRSAVDTDDDLQVAPDAAVEIVDDGAWVTARIWVDAIEVPEPKPDGLSVPGGRLGSAKHHAGGGPH